MATDIPAETTDRDEIPMDELSNLVILNNTGSTLHYYPDAKGAYTDHTVKEFSGYVIDKNGDEHGFHCGNIVFAGDPTDDTVPSPAEIIDDHGYTAEEGERNWGRTL